MPKFGESSNTPESEFQRRKRYWKAAFTECMPTVIFGIIAVFVAYGYLFITSHLQYNNGTCLNCNGHYEYEGFQGVSEGITSVKFYRCDRCGKVIRVFFMPKPE